MLVQQEVEDEIGGGRDAPPSTDRFIEAYLSSFAARHCAISQAHIRELILQAEAEGLSREEIEERLYAELSTWPEKRAAEEARWESVRFGNALAKFFYGAAGVLYLRWVAVDKSCPYCAMLDGKVVGISEHFLRAGSELRPEGVDKPLSVDRNVGHPPAHSGCDCIIVAGG